MMVLVVVHGCYDGVEWSMREKRVGVSPRKQGKRRGIWVYFYTYLEHL